MRARWRTGATILACAVLVMAAPVAAQQPTGLSIIEADLQDDGTTRVTIGLTGDAATAGASPEAFSVLEDGEPVAGVEVTPIEEVEDASPVTTVVALDTSGSTEGAPIDNAKSAAVGFVDSVVSRGVDVGLVTFSDVAELVVPPTSDVSALRAAIGDLDASGETTLNDAVVVAARTLQNFEGQKSIVVFSDGADTRSRADLAGAVNAAATVNASVTTVALQTPDVDVDALGRLAERTGGDLVAVDSAASLGGAFEEVARSLTSQFVLTYEGERTSAQELELTVAVTTSAGQFTDQATVLSPRSQIAVGEPRAVSMAGGLFANDLVLYSALAGAFLAVLLFLYILLVPRGDRRVTRTLRRGLRTHDKNADRGSSVDVASRLARANATRRAVDLVARVPRPEGYDDAIQLKLDRAAWPLRASEFTAARAGAALLGLLVGWGLLGSLLLGVVIGIVAAVLPGVLLDGRVAARQAKFLEQLPDTLQLLAGALKAGYGILQAIDTVVKEAAEPTASEFSRVLTESRLGLPLDESLEAMAERLGSEDFRWVVVAINIQRRVGGNLAELLDTVADTLREREMVRRQIKTLSAEGRLSAIILTVLPFGLGLYLFVINPDYIGVLFERQVGLMMMAGALVLVGVGIVWMRKLIDIDV